MPKHATPALLKKSPTLTEKKTVNLRNNFQQPKNSASLIVTHRLDDTQPTRKLESQEASAQERSKSKEK